jgi:hypothetical protein
VETPTLSVAHAAHICIAIPRGPATSDGVRHIRGALEQLAQRVKSGIGLLFIVAEGVGPPSGETRREVAEMFRAMHPHLKVIAAHMAGSGFIAAAKRSVFTWATSNLVGKTPIRAFSELAEATTWLHARATALDMACPSSLELQTFVSASVPSAR